MLEDLTVTPPEISVPSMESLGGPKGWEWRGPQQALIDRIANSDKRFVLLQAEPGIGKTAIAWGLSKVARGRTCILVHTRQLQRQYLKDFELPLIEGRAHYTCRVTGMEASTAPCASGVKCEHKGDRHRFLGWLQMPDCEYYLAKAQAGMAKVSIHNYAYWLTETKSAIKRNSSSDFSDVDWIVCDEAHDLQSVLMDFNKIRFEQNELYRLGLSRVPLDNNFETLQEWSSEARWKAMGQHDSLAEKLRDQGLYIPLWHEEADPTQEGIEEGVAITDDMRNDLRQLRRNASVLEKLEEAYAGPLRSEDTLNNFWAIDRISDKKEVAFGPLYAHLGMKQVQGAANKVLLMSAYLAPKMLIPMLGLNPDDCDIIEAPPMYDRRSSLFVSTPVLPMSFKTSQAEWKRVVKVIDEIIDWHAPKSGIVIVPSKRLRNIVVEYSRHGSKLITYEGQRNLQYGDLTKDQAIAKLKREGMKKQSVLVGQSISTGVDLPYVIDFSVIVKLAYPPMEDPVLKERMKRDSFFQPYSVMCELVQAAGRSKRAPDHDCTTYILDKHFTRFWARYKGYFPKWFNQYLVDGRKLMPERIEALRKKGVPIG